jgi:alanine dehydrogenase
MKKITIGIIKEGKVPPDHRVPLTPKQCGMIQSTYSNVEILVQASPVRSFKDEEYKQEGIRVVESLEEADIIFGVKEINVADLIPNKTFFFFSHTIKKQPYNRMLLQAVLDKKIRLVDYETLKNKQNKRVIGFGRYAGIVGAYNSFRTYGLKSGRYELKPAHLCKHRLEMEEEMNKIDLPSDYKIVLTGFGRVGHGAREIIDRLPIKEVTPEELISTSFKQPVFAHLELEDYYQRKDGKPFEKSDFYQFPQEYKSSFANYLPHCDMYIPCHFWSDKSPIIISKSDLKSPSNRLSIVGDISCDIDGPIASTIRASKMSDPIYGYDPQTEQEVDFSTEGVIAVMAVDNLPCELPKDASEDFGNELIRIVLPNLLQSDPDHMIDRAAITTFEGNLNEPYLYLQDYVDGKEA